MSMNKKIEEEKYSSKDILAMIIASFQIILPLFALMMGVLALFLILFYQFY